MLRRPIKCETHPRRNELRFARKSSGHICFSLLTSPSRLEFVLQACFCASFLFGAFCILVSELGTLDKLCALVAGIIYNALLLYAVSRMVKRQLLFAPCGVLTFYCYVAYYIRFCLTLLNLRAEYDGYSSYALFDVSSADYLRAFHLSVLAYAAFLVGTTMGFQFRKRTNESIKYRDVDYKAKVSSYLGQVWVGRRLLLLGLGIIVFRSIVTHVLHIGASIGSPEIIGGVPYLAGALQFMTLWGGRLVLATGFAAALLKGSVFYVVISLIEILVFGVFCTIATGSKSEVLIPLIVCAIIIFLMSGTISRRLLLMVTATVFFLLSLVLAVYPTMHNYRYISSRESLSIYLQDRRGEADMIEGINQVIRRLNGIDRLARISAYRRSGGCLPTIGVDLQDFYVNTVENYPDDVEIGLGMGIWGGLFLAGGIFGLALAALALGALAEWVYPFAEMDLSTSPLALAMVAVLSQLLVVFLLFQGLFLFDLKQLFCLVFSYLMLRVFMGEGFPHLHKWRANSPF